MPRKKKLKRKRCEVRCRANGCTQNLFIPEADLNKYVHLCTTCNDRIQNLCENEGMHWFTAHLDESYIMACSRPEILPSSILPLERIESEYSPAEAILEARKIIEKADAMLILAGAGASVDSGLPDFRGAEGYYRYKNKEIPMETINFHTDRGGDLAVSWGFILRMMHMFSATKPHEGYQLLKDICNEKNKKKEGSTFVFTSNIDGYFERAGFDTDFLYECHGSTNYLQCVDLCKKRPQVFHIDAFNKKTSTRGIRKTKKNVANNNNDDDNDDDDDDNSNNNLNSSCCWWNNVKFNEENLTVLNMDIIPTCPRCAKTLRPNISHVTDRPEDICYSRKKKQEKKLLKWLKDHKDDNVSIIEIGCGTSEHSLRDESELLIANVLKNGHLIRIDPGKCMAPEGHVGLNVGFKDAFIQICKGKSKNKNA